MLFVIKQVLRLRYYLGYLKSVVKTVAQIEGKKGHLVLIGLF